MGSYILAVVGITGLLIAARKPRIGWWFNLAAQVVWVTYGVVTGEHGFIYMSVGYTVAYIRLLRQAYRTPPTPPQTCTCSDVGATKADLPINATVA